MIRDVAITLTMFFDCPSKGRRYRHVPWVPAPLRSKRSVGSKMMATPV